MTVLNAFLPVFKTCLDFEHDLIGVRPKSTDLYIAQENGDERLLIPEGSGTYDLYVFCKVPELTGNETDGELRSFADKEGKLRIEIAAPHMIRNVTYIFSVEHWGARFIHSRTRIFGPGNRARYWFFDSRMRSEQIMARIQFLTGKAYTARSEKIADSCQKKHIDPYKDTKKVIAFFSEIGERLFAIGNRAMVRITRTKQKVSEISKTPLRDQAVNVILDIARGALPDAYEDIKAIMMINNLVIRKSATMAGG